MAYVDENEQFDKDALLHKLQSEVDMNVGLTDRQKVLFQEDKHVLVDTIIILEDKLLKAIEKIKSLEKDLKDEVNSRIMLESEIDVVNGAHIKAQEVIDSLEDKMRIVVKDVKEEGENGTL